MKRYSSSTSRGIWDQKECQAQMAPLVLLGLLEPQELEEKREEKVQTVPKAQLVM